LYALVLVEVMTLMMMMMKIMMTVCLKDGIENKTDRKWI